MQRLPRFALPSLLVSPAPLAEQVYRVVDEVCRKAARLYSARGHRLVPGQHILLVRHSLGVLSGLSAR